MSIQLSAFGDLSRPASAVLFAGGGGSCEGIRAAGCQVLIAVNHDSSAIAMHEQNHPDTIHYREDVWLVPPTSRGRELDLLWMSPACTHFSRARGAGVLDEQSRSLAEVAFPWLDLVHPRVLILENVVEFLSWGPLGEDGRPDKHRSGEHFGRWLQAIQSRGYITDWRVLDAHRYGTPTSRRRLYLVARRDDQPIVWPEPTHGPGLLPYRTVRDCLDLSIPACPVGYGREEAREWAVAHEMPVPKRPLAPKTRERIRAGQRMFGEEFLTVYYGNESDGQGLDVPLRTVTAKDRFGLVRHDTLRMLSPRELARCMGFPDSYRLTGGRSEQVARIGNAVCPPVAEALVRGNVLVQQ